jgi:hypothetical protein
MVQPDLKLNGDGTVRRGVMMDAGSAGVIGVWPFMKPSDGSRRTQSEIDRILLHEFGHTLSKRLLGESHYGEGWVRWDIANTTDILSPSGYSNESPQEDFAETLVLYLYVKGTPKEAEMRQLFSARFAILDELLAMPLPVEWPPPA